MRFLSSCYGFPFKYQHNSKKTRPEHVPSQSPHYTLAIHNQILGQPCRSSQLLQTKQLATARVSSHTNNDRSVLENAEFVGGHSERPRRFTDRLITNIVWIQVLKKTMEKTTKNSTYYKGPNRNRHFKMDHSKFIQIHGSVDQFPEKFLRKNVSNPTFHSVLKRTKCLNSLHQQLIPSPPVWHWNPQ